MGIEGNQEDVPEVNDYDDKGVHKSWCYTLFFDDYEKDLEWLKSLDFKSHVCSLKTCPTTGKQHFQGEFTAWRGYRFAQLKKLNNKWRLAARKCTADHNYCRKRDSLVVINYDKGRQGKRRDLEDARECLQASKRMRTVVEQVASSQAVRAAEVYLRYSEPPRPVGPIEVHWYYGPTGTGKTKRVFELEQDLYRPTTYKWWEGYDAHEAVLIDDFRPEWCSFVQLLGLTDIYPFRVECKGGSRQAQYKRVYITSCMSPQSAFCDVPENRNQLYRRITTCLMFHTDKEPTDMMELLKAL